MADTSTAVAHDHLTSGGVTTADLAATSLFALEGAAVGAAAGLDLFGVLVVACVSALGGGIVRDLLIGDVPPAAVRDARYVVVSVAGGAVALATYNSSLDTSWGIVVFLDAAGLGLFAAVGATKAFDFELPAFSAALVGTITAVGGGVMQDLLVGKVPLVLREELYATAALLGASIVGFGLARGMNRTVAAAVGGAACFALRMLGDHHGWSLPTL